MLAGALGNPGRITSGAKSMVIVTGIPVALLVVIIAAALMFVAAPGLIRSIWRVGPAARTSDSPIEVVGRFDAT